MKRALTIALLCAAAGAGAFAAVRAADEPTGYVGKGNVVFRTSLGGSTSITLGGDIAMEELGSRLRIDVLSLAIPGADPNVSALLGTQLFPPGGFTVVYDRKDSSYVVWAPAKHAYYQSAAGTSSTAPAPIAIAPAGTASDLFSAFSFAKQLRTDSALNVSLSLAGHGMVNGHPASGLNFSYQRTTTAGETTDLHGTLQFADDLDGVPVQITMAGKSKAIPDSAFRLDLTSLAKQTPPDADFTPPAGFTRAGSIGDVVGKSLPIPGS